MMGFIVDGCGRPGTTEKKPPTVSSAAKQASDATTSSEQTKTLSSGLSPSQVRLGQVDKARFDAWLQSQKGKVVLVDFWASWCMPCRELFPHTVELHRKWASKGLVVAAVSFDDPDTESEVRQFLAKHQADFENFIAVGPPEPVEAFQIPGGAIPYFRIYGPDGKMLSELTSVQQTIEPAHIDKAVQEALATLSKSTLTK
ncbi:MAG: TlpA family protein disulfide reductase [Thermoguttaceae bacterium]|nr:TlpA family protein disulfide reductase [Thermoguttaceae bacterium]MDW8036920.1 TlpA disulfide reductase family protein [Thermoguttaceae bacterium]